MSLLLSWWFWVWQQWQGSVSVQNFMSHSHKAHCHEAVEGGGGLSICEPKWEADLKVVWWTSAECPF